LVGDAEGEPGQRALLLVDHGSRRPAANRLLDELAERVRARRPGLIVEVAHMELAPPDVAEGIERCFRRGARRIVVHPYFLGPGSHSQVDIPRIAADAASMHPGLEIVVSEPLGVHDSLVDVVLDRYDETDAG